MAAHIDAWFARVHRTLAAREPQLSAEQVERVLHTIDGYIRDYKIRRKRKTDGGLRMRDRAYAERVAKSSREFSTLIESRGTVTAGARKIGIHSGLVLQLDSKAVGVLRALRQLQAIAELVASQPTRLQVDEVRLLLDCGIAGTLADAGVKLSETDRGTLTEVLRAVHMALGIERGADSPRHSARRAKRALAEWRTLPAAVRELPDRAG